MGIAYVARRRLKVSGVQYVPGDSITSEQIGNARLERQLKSLGRIKPLPKPAPAPAAEQVPLVFPRSEPTATVAAQEQAVTPSPNPPRNKGGRPRTKSA